MPYGLNQTQIQEIAKVLATRPAVQQGILFGSRVRGGHKPSSDIDIALKGPQINIDDVLLLSHYLEELDLPYMFDLINYNHIKTPTLIQHIQQEGKIIFERV